MKDSKLYRAAVNAVVGRELNDVEFETIRLMITHYETETYVESKQNGECE